MSDTIERRTNSNTNKIFVLLILLSVFFIALRLTSTVQTVKQLAYYVLMPSLQISSETFTKTGGFIKKVFNIVKINRENNYLKNEIYELNKKLSDYQLVLDDNVRLKNLLKIQENKSFNPVFANVIIREPSQWYQWVIINKGSSDGISKNCPVIAVLSNGDTSVFGRVFEVYQKTSKVALITNSLVSVPVQIKKYNVDCIVEGFNEQYLKLSFVPDNLTLSVGDEIVTSQLSDVFDRGIKVGKVSDIIKNDYGQYQDIIVEPYSLIKSVYEIVVLKN
ncbi:MAG: rod shape-determining protein MreC, partial [Elusimicrobia bacterium]|nr:rod shape-determining protein MreC [Elusimicrobiota bacterium]